MINRDRALIVANSRHLHSNVANYPILYSKRRMIILERAIVKQEIENRRCENEI